MIGIMATLHPLLLLGKTSCCGYIHWTQQYESEISGTACEEEYCAKATEYQTLPAMRQHISKKYCTEKNVHNQTFKIWKNADLQQPE